MSLATYEPTLAGSVDVISAGHVQKFTEFAKTLAVSGMLPDGLRGNPANVFMAIMQGLDLGLRPMQALNLIDVIKGKPGLKPEGMRALIQSAGHEWRDVEVTAEKCVIRARRKGTEYWNEVTYTIEQAKTAGDYAKNAIYKARPEDMLYARCSVRMAKRHFSDVINGLPSVDDLQELAPEPERPTLAQAAAEREKPAEAPAASPERTRADVLAAAAEFEGVDVRSDSDVADAEVIDDMFAGSDGQA